MTKQYNGPSLAEEFNARIDCEDLADKLGLERPGGKNYRSPGGEDKNPSLSVYRDKTNGRSRFKDFKTGSTGGPLNLYMHVQGMDPDNTEQVATALKELGRMYPDVAGAWQRQYGRKEQGPQPAPRERTRAEWIADQCLDNMATQANRDTAMEYLTGRGIAEAVVQRWIDRKVLGLNTWVNDRFERGAVGHGGTAVAFIVRSPDTNRVVATDMRYLDAQANGGVKTQSQGEKEGFPFCSDWRRFQAGGTVYVCESAINAASIETADPRAAVIATRGTAVGNVDWRMCIGKRVVVCMDNDKPLTVPGPKNGYRPGLMAAWAIHEALVALDVPCLLVDQGEWLDDDEEPINDLNDYLQAEGAASLAQALKKLEHWLIPGMWGKGEPGKPRLWLPAHDFAEYWRFRVREDFTHYVDKYKEADADGDGKAREEMVKVCGFRIAGISRVTIASPVSTMTGDKDTSPNTVFALSVQVPRHGHRLLRRVVQDEQLHNVEVWKKLGPVFSAPNFLRMVNVMERAADIGARGAVNFVGLAWRDGKVVVNEGPDTYFVDPRQQCPYSNLVFPSGPQENAAEVLQAFQATFQGNAVSQLLTWALGAHLKAFLGFWPHFMMQASKGSGKSTVVKRLERTVGMTVFSGQSLQTEFRILTSISATTQPVGWEELSARKQELINKAVTNLQECYQYSHTRRGADLVDFLLCAPVLLMGEDVPVDSLTGKMVRNRMAKEKRGALMPEGTPVFPVRQWLQYLADTPKPRVLELFERCQEHMTAACRASRDDAGAERMVSNYSALRAAWILLCDFAGMEANTGRFMEDLTAEMNAHISETSAARHPWVWIVDTLLSEIARGTFRYPFHFDVLDEEPILCVRTGHVMDHLSRENSLREFYDSLPVKSDRVFKHALIEAGVLATPDIERTVHGKRVAHMVALSLPALEQFGLSAVRPETTATEGER